jgi:hypothetical protein
MGARPQGGDDSRRSAAGHTSCERCGADIIRQKTGLPWVVTADAGRLTPDQATKKTTPNRLAWCLRESKWSGMRLVMVLPVFHSPVCMWAHVIEHECPAEVREFGRRPEGAMW